MATIKAPNPHYEGTSVGVVFKDGVGETKDQSAIAWLTHHGYQVVTAKGGKEKS